MVEAPLYADLVIGAVYLLLAASLAVVGWSVVCQARRRGRGVSRLSLGVAVGVVLLLLLTWLTGSSEPFRVGGRLYADGSWLRLADMFVHSSIILIVVCSVIVIAAKFRR